MHFKVSDISCMFDTTHFNNMLILKFSFSRMKTNYVNVGNIYLFKTVHLKILGTYTCNTYLCILLFTYLYCVHIFTY